MKTTVRPIFSLPPPRTPSCWSVARWSPWCTAFSLCFPFSTRKYYKVQKGEKFALERRKQQADITKDMLDADLSAITLKPYPLTPPSLF